MSDESENPLDEAVDTEKESESSSSTETSHNSNLQDALTAQKVAEQAIQPSILQSVIEVQEIVNQAFKPSLIHDAIRMQEMMDHLLQPTHLQNVARMQKTIESAIQPDFIYNAIRMQEMMDEIVNPSLFRTAIQAQKVVNHAIQPAMLDSIIELQNSLDSALLQLNSPSIAADISAISANRYPHPAPILPQTEETDKYPATDVDKIRPPETRIHDKLIWDNGEWYRRRTLEISFQVVDYIFWRAKEAGELTDASDEEVTMGAIAAAFFITLALTGNPTTSFAVASATGTMTSVGSKAAKSRAERKGLDDKFR